MDNTTFKTKFQFLDGLRGLAALMVLIGHAKWLLQEGYSEGYLLHPQLYSIADKAGLYFFRLFRFGHEAVMFFFVLSGFLIHFNYARKLAVDIVPAKEDFVKFYYRRAMRIFPPFLAALAITFIVDSIGKDAGYSIYQNSTPYPSINGAATFDLSLVSLVGNLFFILEPTVTNFGSNSVVWSLKYEWWFYMIYPLLLVISIRNIRFGYIAVVVLWALSFIDGIWPLIMMKQIFSLFICWWMGVFLADVYAGRIKLSLKYLAMAMLALVPAFFVHNNILYDFFVAAFFMGIVAFLFTLNENSIWIKLIGRFSVIGRFSYTLYIVHFPILILLSGYLINTNGFLPIHSGFIFLGIVVVIAFAYVVFRVVEKPFIKN